MFEKINIISISGYIPHTMNDSLSLLATVSNTREQIRPFATKLPLPFHISNTLPPPTNLDIDIIYVNDIRYITLKKNPKVGPLLSKMHKTDLQKLYPLFNQDMITEAYKQVLTGSGCVIR